MKKTITLIELKHIIRKIIKEESNKEKPKLIFLIGPPSVGKSSYIKEKKYDKNPDYVIINRDEIVLDVAKKNLSLNIGDIVIEGTYDDLYQKPPETLKNKITIPIPSIENFDKEIPQFIDHIKKVLNIFKVTEEYKEYIKDIKLKIIQRINAKNNNIFINKSIEEVDKELENKYKKNLDQIIKDIFGSLEIFSFEQLKQYIVDFRYNTKFLNPFHWSKVKEANDEVTKLLEEKRDSAAQEMKNIIIDMTNITKGERNTHRKNILNSLKPIKQETDFKNIFDQIAIVFAKDENGYTNDQIEKIKKSAKKRADEIQNQGGSKRIPDGVFDHMLKSFEKPTTDEGFISIEYVGIPSINNISEIFKKFRR